MYGCVRFALGEGSWLKGCVVLKFSSADAGMGAIEGALFPHFPILFLKHLIFYFLIFWLHSLWDLCSPTRD